jgi:hypothetical protein
MDSIVWYLENLKTGSPDHDFVIDDALHHIQLAQEALQRKDRTLRKNALQSSSALLPHRQRKRLFAKRPGTLT